MSSSSQSGSNMPISWRSLASSRLATSLKDYAAQKDYKGALESISSRVRGTREDGTKQTWDQWARQKFGGKEGSATDTQKTAQGVEKLQLFPGWAVRRFRNPGAIRDECSEFDLEIYVSGFASSLRPPEAATRSQKAFYRLARGYAALPKLTPTSTHAPEPSTPELAAALENLNIPSDIDLSKLPPRPSEINDDTDLEALEAHFRRINAAEHATPTSETHASPFRDTPHVSNEDPNDDTPKPHRSNSYGFPQGQDRNSPTPTASETSSINESSQESPSYNSTSIPGKLTDLAAQMHANLDARLKPFWSSAIPNRPVRISIFCPANADAPTTAQDTLSGLRTDTEFEPLITANVTTSNQGAFQTKIYVPWERLTTHPPSLHLAFGDRDVEYPVVVQAEMWALPPPVSPSAQKNGNGNGSVPHMGYQKDKAALSTPSLTSTSPGSSSISPSPSPSPSQDNSNPLTSVVTRVTISLPVPYVPVRVVSDIDDTVKYAGVLHGAKKVFQTVFTKHLEELVIPGMVKWYSNMWKRGVRFRYVSNSPFELLPVLNEFFQVSTLPEGSLRLKSYAARALLPALLSPAAARKRDGVLEVLNAFPDSHFILVGDTGEQDMELYAEIARDRPHQITGVFVRDVTTDPEREEPVMTPNGELAYGIIGGTMFFDQSNGEAMGRLVDREPDRIRTMPSMESLQSLASSSSTTSSGTTQTGSLNPPVHPSRSPLPHAPSTTSFTSTRSLARVIPKRKSSGGFTPEEKRRFELIQRIELAREAIPRHIAFRVFRDPDECVEVEEILDKLFRK